MHEFATRSQGAFAKIEMIPRSPEMNCSVARALELVGDTWTFLILFAAFHGQTRFSEIQASLGISRNRLSERLSHLVKSGLLKEAAYSETRFEYRPTAKAHDFFPATIMLMAWSERWLPGERNAPSVLIHKCGRPLDPVTVCNICGGELKASGVRYENGPGAGFTASKSSRRTRRSTSAGIFQQRQDSALARALAAVGDRWSFLLLRELFFGATRFEEFLSHLGVARNILTERLKQLLAHGVIRRVPYQTNPVRYDYKLSASGQALYQPILALIHWGDTRLAGKKGKPLNLIHRDCGHEFSPRVVCRHCGKAILARDVTPCCLREAD